MNILPQSTLRIVRQLTDPYDTGTNYVQAVIRNSTTGGVVATLNLTDETAQRFTGQYTTPPDISGMGYYLDVTTTVYSDSAYTTKNTNYAIEAHTYFIHEQKTHFGGGGGDVNYDKIRKIVQEILDGQEKQEMPTIKDLTPEIKAMEQRIKDSVSSAVSSIRFPEQVRPDLDGVVSRISATVENAINTVLMSIEQKEVTPETDLTPITQAIESLPLNEQREATQELQTLVNTLQELVNTQSDVDSMRLAAEEFMDKVKPRTLTAPKEKPKEENTSALRARRLLGV
jgi:hypothetical protein